MLPHAAPTASSVLPPALSSWATAEPPIPETLADAAEASPARLDGVETPLQALIDRETPEDTDAANADLECFRHSFWSARRAAVRKALAEAGATPGRLARFDACGRNAWVMRSVEDPSRVRVVSDRCHDRYCEACQVEHRRLLVRNLREQLPEGRIRLTTLTLRSSARPLHSQLSRIYACWTLLRKHAELKGTFAGGVAFFEITLNDQTGLFHPHLHVLWQGKFLHNKVLQRLWLEITGDSFVAETREVKGKDHAAAYVAKYAAKMIGPSIVHSPKHLVDCIRSLMARRVFNAFGTWRGMKLSRKPDENEGWAMIAPLWRILQDARHGVRDARALLALLNRSYEDVPPDGSIRDGPACPMPDLFDALAP